MPTATLTSKGQVTIPKPVRDFLGIDSGDALDFEIMEQGEVVLRPIIHDVTAIKGMLKRPKQKRVSIDEMNAAIRKRFMGMK